MKFIDVNQQISNFLNHFPHLSDDEKLTFLHFNQFHQHRPIDEISEIIFLYSEKSIEKISLLQQARLAKIEKLVIPVFLIINLILSSSFSFTKNFFWIILSRFLIFSSCQPFKLLSTLKAQNRGLVSLVNLALGYPSAVKIIHLSLTKPKISNFIFVRFRRIFLFLVVSPNPPFWKKLELNFKFF